MTKKIHPKQAKLKKQYLQKRLNSTNGLSYRIVSHNFKSVEMLMMFFAYEEKLN